MFNIPMPILTKKNAREWFTKMKCLLQIKGYDDIVFGQNAEILKSAAGQDEAAKNVDDDAFIKKSNEQNVRARYILINAVDGYHLQLIENLPTARDQWTRLVQEHSDSQPMNIQNLLKEYYSSKWESTLSPSEYIAYLDGLVARLRDVGHKVTDGELVAKVISTLPPEYERFNASWNVLPEQFRTKQWLISSLKQFADDVQFKKTAEKGDALIAKAGDKKRYRRNKGKFTKRANRRNEEEKRVQGLQENRPLG